MSQPYLGEIKCVAYTFAPKGWSFCNGQLMSIAQNSALFSLLGTTYGGNGQTTFALPNLQGRVPTHLGQGPGLSSYDLGEITGAETATLIINEMPSHAHIAVLPVSDADGTTKTPTDPTHTTNILYAKGGRYAPSSNATSPSAIGNAGGGQPFSLLQPYLALYFIIAVEGLYPARN